MRTGNEDAKDDWRKRQARTILRELLASHMNLRRQSDCLNGYTHMNALETDKVAEHSRRRAGKTFTDHWYPGKYFQQASSRLSRVRRSENSCSLCFAPLSFGPSGCASLCIENSVEERERSPPPPVDHSSQRKENDTWRLLALESKVEELLYFDEACDTDFPGENQSPLPIALLHDFIASHRSMREVASLKNSRSLKCHQLRGVGCPLNGASNGASSTDPEHNAGTVTGELKARNGCICDRKEFKGPFASVTGALVVFPRTTMALELVRSDGTVAFGVRDDNEQSEDHHNDRTFEKKLNLTEDVLRVLLAFVDEFTGAFERGVVESAILSTDFFGLFLCTMEEKLYQHPVWYKDDNEYSHEYWDDMFEGLENFLFKRLHSYLVTPDLRRRDDTLKKQMAALGCISSAQLGVEWAGFDRLEDWELAMSHVVSLENTCTLREKLTCLNACLSAITDTITALHDRLNSQPSWNSDRDTTRRSAKTRKSIHVAVAADDLLPAVIMVVTRALVCSSCRIISHLELVSRHKRYLPAHDQYCMVTFMSAVEFLVNREGDSDEPG